MFIEVKITYDPNAETLGQALASLGMKAASTDSMTPKAESMPQPETKTTNQEAVTPVEKVENAPHSETAEPEKIRPVESVTKTDIRAIATAVSKAGKKAELKAVLAEFGATNLSGVDESSYPALKEKLEALNA